MPRRTSRCEDEGPSPIPECLLRRRPGSAGGRRGVGRLLTAWHLMDCSPKRVIRIHAVSRPRAENLRVPRSARPPAAPPACWPWRDRPPETLEDRTFGNLKRNSVSTASSLSRRASAVDSLSVVFRSVEGVSHSDPVSEPCEREWFWDSVA